jgi:hypothetical protein
VSILVETENMRLAGAVLVGDREGSVAHGDYSMCFRGLSSHRLK